MLSLQLQKSPTPDFEEKCGNSPDISKGIFQSGMSKFESSQVGLGRPFYWQTVAAGVAELKLRRIT
jgi:hypothetical protein